LLDDLEPIRPDHIHFVAIGGTGMGALAGLCKRRGIHVTGSDRKLYPPMSTKLDEWGIDVDEGFRAENVLEREPDLVVIGNAVRADNPEAQAVLEGAIPHLSFPDALFELALKPKHRIVVTGTHGKTTTTTMIASLLHHMKRKPSFLVGGIPLEFGDSFRDGEGEDFVVEGDEYDTAFFDKTPKFLHYNPDVLVITSVEFDHADIYRDLDHVKSVFRELVSRMPVDGVIFAATDQPGVADVVTDAPCEVVSYGVDRGEEGPSRADWRGSAVDVGTHGTAFQVTPPRGLARAFTCAIRSAGRFNAENALVALAIADHLELPMLESAVALGRFEGVKRRMEVRGVARGSVIVDDFAHHPTAVRESVAAARLRFHERRLIAVLEPRTNTSRRAIFQDDYARAFEGADTVVVRRVDDAPIYSATGEVGERFSADQLVADLQAQGKRAIALSPVEEIVEFLSAEAEAGDVILVMSNGGFDGIFDKLFAALGGPDPGGYRDLQLREERARARAAARASHELRMRQRDELGLPE
jgi:UDP-N-acetylmuramate: L-alanyl-gamma-D-glutamyl-meso-diaminopimelate ligase